MATTIINFHELRIGNKLKCKVSNDAAIYSVLNLDGWMMRVGLDGVRKGEWYPVDKLKPILLTPKVLKTCGFDVKKSTPAYPEAMYVEINSNSGNFFRLYVSDTNDCPTIHLKASSDWFPRLAEIRYLHQLQNLFFALTGGELIINL